MAKKKKKKRSKKSTVEIKEEVMSPYYLIREDKQFVKMIEGKTLPQGYYTKLSHAVDSIAKDLLLEQNAGSTLSLRKYVDEYDRITNEILDTLKG